MGLILTVIIAAVLALVVYLIMSVVPGVARFAPLGALLTFLLVLLARLGGWGL